MGSIEVTDELSGVGGLIILAYLIDYKDDLQEAVKKRDFSSSCLLHYTQRAIIKFAKSIYL